MPQTEVIIKDVPHTEVITKDVPQTEVITKNLRINNRDNQLDATIMVY